MIKEQRTLFFTEDQSSSVAIAAIVEDGRIKSQTDLIDVKLLKF
jgi:hypothetical protein